MIIHSPQPQARHKPRAAKKTKKDYPLAQVLIDTEPAESEKDPGWYYFKVKHLNSDRHNWAVLCREDQASWVSAQKRDNMQLLEGTHFADGKIQTDNGLLTRSVLDEGIYLEEPEPEEDPMHWAMSGNEVAVDQSQLQADPPEITDPVIDETLRRWDMLLVCCKAAGIEIPPEQKAESLRALMSGTLIDDAMGRLKK